MQPKKSFKATTHRCHSSAMSSYIDSTSVFRTRAAEIGLSARATTALVTGDIDTFAKLFFSSTFQLGQADDTALITVLTDALAGAAPATIGEKACFRRMHFEAATLMMNETKSKMDRTDDAPPRKVPTAERAARYDEQVVRLSGMSLQGTRECAHSLIDEVFQQREDDVLRYLSPDKCPMRNQELLKTKSDPTVKLDKDGQIKILKAAQEIEADTSSELATRAAFCRRALAYDQAKLVTFAVMESWHDWIFEQHARDVPDGYATVNMTQLLTADRALPSCSHEDAEWHQAKPSRTEAP